MVLVDFVGSHGRVVCLQIVGRVIVVLYTEVSGESATESLGIHHFCTSSPCLVFGDVVPMFIQFLIVKHII